jgi:hypothetical protein
MSDAKSDNGAFGRALLHICQQGEAIECCSFQAGHRRSISFMILFAHSTAFAIAVIVAGRRTELTELPRGEDRSGD